MSTSDTCASTGERRSPWPSRIGSRTDKRWIGLRVTHAALTLQLSKRNVNKCFAKSIEQVRALRQRDQTTSAVTCTSCHVGLWVTDRWLQPLIAILRRRDCKETDGQASQSYSSFAPFDAILAFNSALRAASPIRCCSGRKVSGWTSVKLSPARLYFGAVNGAG